MSNPQIPNPVLSAPKIERVRHYLKRRLLTVAHVENITPGMLRIIFGGDDLSDFVSMAPDDHIKIFVPATDGTEERRDYTPRRYDAAARTLAIDFAIHEAGPRRRCRRSADGSRRWLATRASRPSWRLPVQRSIRRSRQTRR